MFANEQDAQHLRRLAYKLRRNDAAFQKFYLPLDDLSDIHDVTRSVRVNQTVREVSIFCEYLEDDWVETQQDVWRLFRAVGSLPKLERLVFDYVGSQGDELPLTLLAAIVRPAVGLQSLELSCVHLTGDLEDFVGFAQVLRQKPLKTFQIYGSYLNEELRGSALRLDLILEEITSLGTLVDVQITALDFQSLGRVSAQSLGALLHLSPSLKNLVLGEFALDDEHLVAMSVAMENNQTVKELSFGCDLGAAGATALSMMLRSNETLEVLHLHLARLEGGEGHHIRIAQALKANRGMKRFSLFGNSGNMTTKTQLAYLELLTQNYNLEELEFQEEDECIQPQMEMFLKLNTFGRGRLLQSDTASREHWCAVIIALHDDLDCVFHLISLNPTIVPAEVIDVAERGTKRKR